MNLVFDRSFAVLEALMNSATDHNRTARLLMKVMFERKHLRSAGLIRQKWDFYA